MSEAREQIFARLEAARPPAGPEPTRVSPPPMPAEPLTVLAARVAQAGGRFERARRGNWPDRITWPRPLAAIEHLYVGRLGDLGAALDRAPASRVVARGAGLDPACVHDLAPIEVCVLRGEFAVVENGAAWQQPDSALERASALLAEHLIVLVDEKDVVPSLHEAYRRIDLSAIGFGWFLCGPSKTADIEQALVLGAHGPKTMSLVLLGDDADSAGGG